MNITTELRPTAWEDVIGQDDTVKLLQSWVRDRRKGRTTPSAILIAGESGCGKTSISRLFGLALNCKRLKPGFNPCLKCFNCKAIMHDYSLFGGHAFFEVDCNCDNGVRNIKSVMKMSFYASRFTHKLIVLDEAQGLSHQAKNLLIKPVENFYDHVIWVLITTEPKKFNKQLVSRLNPVPMREITAASCLKILRRACSKLDYKFKKRELKEIVEKAEGNPRVALETLQNRHNIRNF
jgi:DNA polymerase III subunit gamma/tau